MWIIYKFIMLVVQSLDCNVALKYELIGAHCIYRKIFILQGF